MRLFQFKLFDTDKDLQSFLESHSNVSEFIRKILDDVRTGKLSYSSDTTTKEKLEKAKLENYGYKNRIDSVRAEQYEKYDNTFGSVPSTLGQKAIETYAKRDPTNEEFQNISKFITLRKDSQNSSLWIAKCDICKEGETYQTHKEAIDDMIRHLTTEHAKKVRYVR